MSLETARAVAIMTLGALAFMAAAHFVADASPKAGHGIPVAMRK